MLLCFLQRKFKIKFDGRGMKVVGSKGIAYTDHPKDNLLVGSRVIGQSLATEVMAMINYSMMNCV